jgi:hypothetical protein
MMFILAAEGGGIPLVFSRPQGADGGSKLVDLASVVRPVTGSLRGDSAVIMRLRLAKQVGDRA